MFTNVRFQPPILNGDAGDARTVLKALTDYLQALEAPDALSISEPFKWTPAASFATAGDAVFTPSIQTADGAKIRDEVVVTFRYVGTVTHTTAAGNLQITGLPFVTSSNTNFIWDGSCVYSGITKAGYSSVRSTLVAGSSTILFTASGSGVTAVVLTSADVPTGGTLVLRGTLRYRV